MFANNVIGLNRTTTLPPRRRQNLRRFLAHLWTAAARAAETVNSRRRLAEVDDRTLADLGISRAQAQYEASRPVWDQGTTYRQ
jgi:uncharacterized protein YjiS (DUF1127 family)